MIGNEPLGKMIIEMDLNSAKFTSSLTAVNRSIKSAEREMKANMTVLNNADDKYGALGKQVEGLNKIMSLNEKRIEQLNEKRKEALKTHDASSEAVQKLNKEINIAVQRQSSWEKKLRITNEKLQEMEQEIKISNSTLGKFGSKLDALSQKTDKLGDSLNRTLLPALGGLGIAIGKVGMDVDTSSAKLSNALGLTAEEAKNTQKSVKKVWSDGFGSSMSDVTEATIQVKQNIRDLNEEDLANITKQSMTLAETFNSDINEVTRAGNNLMKGFGVSSQKSMDLMSKGAQKGLNMSNEMFDNLTEYTPLWSKMGYSAEDMFNTLISASNEGVYNLDFVNDAMKEFQIRLKDGSKTTSDAMGEMSIESQNVWKSFLNGKATVKDVNDAILGELQGMDDQVKANQIGVGLYGVKWEDLESTAMYALGNVEDAMGNVDGSAKKMTDTVEKTFKQESIAMIRGYGKALLPLGETLLDIGKDVLPPFKEGIADVSAMFNGMSDGAKKTTLILGGLLLATGPVVKLLSPFAKGFHLAAKGVVLFKDKVGKSQKSLNTETIALDSNTAALQRNNNARNGAILGGKSSKKNKMPTSTTPNVSSNGLGKVGKDGLLKKGKSLSKVAKGGGLLGLALGGFSIYDALTSKEADKGAGIGSATGSMAGGAIGAALGSFIPGFGTALGGLAGSVAGDKLGTLIGQEFDKNAKKKKEEKAKKEAEKGASLNLKIKGVSESTQVALGEYDKLYQGAKVKLNQIMMSNSVINEKIKNDTIKNFSTMKNSVIKSVKERQQKEREEAEKALDSNKKLSVKEKQQALAELDKKHKAEIKSINDGNARVKSIMSKASKEKRGLTRKEKTEIKRINDQMYDTKIKKTAKGEKEITAINRRRSKQRHDITTKEMRDTINAAKKEYDKTVETAKNKYNKKVEYAKIQYKKLGIISKDEYEKIVNDAKKEKDKVIDHAKKKKDSVISNANTQKKESTKASKEQKEKNIANAKKETEGVGKAFSSLSKFVKATISFFKNLFGNDEKTPDPPKLKEYANGTHQGSHPGGTALVGEVGAELSYIPGSGYKLLGVGGPQVLDLPRGSAVLPHDKTKKVLNQYNFPAYKSGTNDDNLFEKAFGLITEAPSKLWDKLVGKFNYVDTFPKFFNSWAGPTGVTGWAKDLVLKYINNMFADSGGGDTTISNKWGVYDFLFQIAQKVMSSSLGKGLVITSGHRPGDTYDHGKHAAIDLSGFGSNGGYKAVAQWAAKLPGVSYTIGDNTVFGKKYGNGSKPGWATGHMNHVHISASPSNVVSGGVEKWRGIAARALKMTGQYSTANLNRLLYQMKTESGGNSRAINNWDSNAKRGTPSKGLMQVIDPTFRSYAMKGYNKNIYDPLSNILASIRYSLSTYGSLSKAWRGVGYENGGIINKQHLAMLGEGNKKEVVIPLEPKPGMRSRALDLLAYAAEKLLGGSSTATSSNVEGNNAILQALVKQTEMMQQQINLLTQLVTKNNDIYLDGKEITNYVKTQIAKEDYRKNRARGVAIT